MSICSPTHCWNSYWCHLGAQWWRPSDGCWPTGEDTHGGCWSPSSLELVMAILRPTRRWNSWLEPTTGRNTHAHTHRHTPTYGVEGAGLPVAHPVTTESHKVLELSHIYFPVWRLIKHEQIGFLSTNSSIMTWNNSNRINPSIKQ